MSREAKFIICQVQKQYDRQGNCTYKYGHEIATFDCRSVGYECEYEELFERKVDFDIYIEDQDNPQTEDKYGAPLYYTDDLAEFAKAVKRENDKLKREYDGSFGNLYYDLMIGTLKKIVKLQNEKGVLKNSKGSEREWFVAVVPFYY